MLPAGRISFLEAGRPVPLPLAASSVSSRCWYSASFSMISEALRTPRLRIFNRPCSSSPEMDSISPMVLQPLLRRQL